MHRLRVRATGVTDALPPSKLILKNYFSFHLSCLYIFQRNFNIIWTKFTKGKLQLNKLTKFWFVFFLHDFLQLFSQFSLGFQHFFFLQNSIKGQVTIKWMNEILVFFFYDTIFFKSFFGRYSFSDILKKMFLIVFCNFLQDSNFFHTKFNKGKSRVKKWTKFSFVFFLHDFSIIFGPFFSLLFIWNMFGIIFCNFLRDFHIFWQEIVICCCFLLARDRRTRLFAWRDWNAGSYPPPMRSRKLPPRSSDRDELVGGLVPRILGDPHFPELLEMKCASVALPKVLYYIYRWFNIRRRIFIIFTSVL